MVSVIYWQIIQNLVAYVVGITNIIAFILKS